jgi:hypothetical protein
MTPTMLVFSLALRFEVDGSPALSPPARWQAFVQKCTIERRGVRATVVPVGWAFVVITIVVVVINVLMLITLTRKLDYSVAKAPYALSKASVKRVVI